MKIRNFIIALIIPLAVGFIGSLLGGTNNFDTMIKPSFTPPGYIFPIVWTILYILMGISSYIVYENNKNKDNALTVYFIQLFFNMTWPLLFFRFNLYLLSFIWILILIALVIIMIYKFYKTSKLAGLLQVPYLLWLIFASILTLGTFLLN